MRALGRIKDLASHRGYSGRLSAPANGMKICYAGHATYEIAFHANTLMPTVRGDPQQIAKKKFIGNDPIQVVWNESDKPYQQNTIKSNFNFAHVVLQPLSTGLVRVSILRKADCIQHFGPLMDGMLVSCEILPILVRATIINADRAIRDPRLRSRPAYSCRKQLLQSAAATPKSGPAESELLTHSIQISKHLFR